MFRGQFTLNGQCLPNNITKAGAQQILKAAMRAEEFDIYVGLCSAVYGVNMTLADLEEPTIGVNGYARQQLSRDDVDWPTLAEQLGSPYIESKQLTFTPTGAGFDLPVTRMFICHQATGLVGPVFALSAALSEPVDITESLNVVYRLFAR